MFRSSLQELKKSDENTEKDFEDLTQLRKHFCIRASRQVALLKPFPYKLDLKTSYMSFFDTSIS
jgi:hypothetical protein